MTTDAFEASGLDHDTLVLVWLAALVALDDALTERYPMNLGAASQTTVSVDRVHQVLDGTRTESSVLPACSLRPPESRMCSAPALDPGTREPACRRGASAALARMLIDQQAVDGPDLPGEPHTKCHGKNVGTPVADPPPTCGGARKAEPEPSASTRRRSPHTARAQHSSRSPGLHEHHRVALGLTARFAAGHRTDALGAPSGRRRGNPGAFGDGRPARCSSRTARPARCESALLPCCTANSGTGPKIPARARCTSRRRRRSSSRSTSESGSSLAPYRSLSSLISSCRRRHSRFSASVGPASQASRRFFSRSAHSSTLGPSAQRPRHTPSIALHCRHKPPTRPA